MNTWPRVSRGQGGPNQAGAGVAGAGNRTGGRSGKVVTTIVLAAILMIVLGGGSFALLRGRSTSYGGSTSPGTSPGGPGATSTSQAGATATAQAGATATASAHSTATAPPIATATSGGNGGGGALPDGHYLYVFTDGQMYVYDMDTGFSLAQQHALPTSSGTRGVAVDPPGHALYVSYGGDGGGFGNGSLLRYDLVANHVAWTQSYSHGIDSMAITPDGSTIYMPDGELTNDGKWYAVRTSNGSETGMVINTGAGTGDNGPHNTVVSLDGRYLYMGDRNYASSGANNFYRYDLTTGNLKAIGHFKSGIRPFTVNRANTLVYTSVTGFLGFQIGDLNPSSPTYGQVIDTTAIVKPAGASCSRSGASDPSHGISMSPSEQELYVIDFTCNYVHVFDISSSRATAPVQVADIPVTPFNSGESPCAYDCLGDGWLLHTLDGRYVIVGDTGDIIGTASRSVVKHLTPLYNTRKFIEIDWRGGAPVATTTRHGLGRA